MHLGGAGGHRDEIAGLGIGSGDLLEMPAQPGKDLQVVGGVGERQSLTSTLGIGISPCQSRPGEPGVFPGVGRVKENNLVKVPDRQQGQNGAGHLLAADKAQGVRIVEAGKGEEDFQFFISP